MNWNIPLDELDCNDFLLRDISIYENEITQDQFFDNIRQDVSNERFHEYDKPWQNFPDMDIQFPWRSCRDVALESFNPPCGLGNVLGYYIPYHFVMVSYRNKYGVPKNHQEVLMYNEKLPRNSRFGIHLCEETIIKYIESRAESKMYFELSLALLVQNVIAHEWGHYRAELNAIQQMIHLQSVSSDQRMSYVNYILMMNGRHNNFEEVFADYCGLKLGIFNPKYKNPDPLITKTEQLRMTQYQLSIGLFKNRNSPYGDLKFWMKNPYQMDNAVVSLVNNPQYANRMVKLSLNLNSAHSPYSSELIDVLTHNQAQFIKNRNMVNRIISSRGPYIDFNELDSFWQYTAKDDFMNIPRVSKKTSLNIDLFGTHLEAVLEKILSPASRRRHGLYKLPLDTFPELLPLSPVMVH